MKRLNYEQAHEYVEKSPTAFWDGWDLVLFTPTRAGATSARGIYRDGRWGIAMRISPNAEGNWLIR